MFTLIHAEGVLEVQPVVAMRGTKEKFDIDATLGLMRPKLGRASNEDLVHCEEQGGDSRRCSRANE